MVAETQRSAQRGIGRRIALLGVIVAVALPLLDAAWKRVQGVPWSLFRTAANQRNPAWSAARWRGNEHPARTDFFQWYYVLVSDTLTRRTFSIGFGGFRGDHLAGGWVRMKCPAGDACDGYSSSAFPQEWGDFAGLTADDTLAVHIRVQNTSETTQRAEFSIEPVPGSATQLRYRASLPAHNCSFDLLFTRVYGTFAGGEECALANVPFAYDSRVTGVLRMNGQEYVFEDSPRFRAYVESTWGCTLPKPGPGTGDPRDYPWKWMWIALPESEELRASQARTGPLRGEVGLVVANARMWHHVLGSITATFVYLDMCEEDVSGTCGRGYERRWSAANVTAFDDTSLPVPVLLAADGRAGHLLHVKMSHDRWDMLQDSRGVATIPMWQELLVVTEGFAINVTFHSQLDDYSRLPVVYRDQDRRRHVCSDFRGAHSFASIQLWQRNASSLNGGASKCPLFAEAFGSGDCSLIVSAVSPHNAIEYAYHAPYNAYDLPPE